ncbi:cysteine proteinase, partial [Lepidopterella palustris CBS 459.81]
FQDVLSLDDPELLAFIPRPALALVLAFPTTDIYENQKAQEEGIRDYKDTGEDVLWFKQKINNACGLYAVLHAVCNGTARGQIDQNSTFAEIIHACTPLNSNDRADFVEDNKALEVAFEAVARQGDTEAPQNPEDEVDFHYICFVKSEDNHLYELDGDRKGPIDHGVLEAEDDVLCERSLGVIRDLIALEKGENLNFSLMAL